MTMIHAKARRASARLVLERRREQQRRSSSTDVDLPALVASSSVFGREERGVLRSMERRRQIRRQKDLSRNLARLREIMAER